METTNTNTLLIVSALGSLIGAACGQLFQFLLKYRELADAGQLRLLQAQQVSNTQQLEELKKETLECHQRHAEALTQVGRLEGKVEALNELLRRDVAQTAALALQQAEHGEKVAQIEKRINGTS